MRSTSSAPSAPCIWVCGRIVDWNEIPSKRAGLLESAFPSLHQLLLPLFSADLIEELSSWAPAVALHFIFLSASRRHTNVLGEGIVSAAAEIWPARAVRYMACVRVSMHHCTSMQAPGKALAALQQALCQLSH